MSSRCPEPIARSSGGWSRRRPPGAVAHDGVTTRRRVPAPSCALLAVLVLLTSACDREERRYRESPPSATPTGVVRVSSLQPGPMLDSTHVANAYQENAYAISEGQRLFNWYNCSGCHANGGGGMGPPLIDDEWVYGGAPENVYATIVQGRPNGMPSFGTRIPASQVWQIVAYVRSLGGLTPVTVRSSRPDHMMYQPGSTAIPRPRGGTRADSGQGSSRPPGAEMP